MVFKKGAIDVNPGIGRRTAAALLLAVTLSMFSMARADNPAACPGTATVKTSFPFDTLVSCLKKTIADNR
ncbi:MAG: hypothetical protein EPN49_06070 [Rhodanobacter sp.]|nr:MAG: hypothetical protein EPN49_06070 [Rhodanobacter sp.]